MNRTVLLICMLSLVCSFNSNLFAQDKPIGQWQSHLPYNTAVSIAKDDVRLYVATRYSFYTYTFGSEELEAFSKVNGMSDIGVSKIAYDRETGSAIIAYSNSNIDIYRDGTFYNIPDLKLKSVTGSKEINDIYTINGQAILSTDIGIIVLNLDRVEVKETYSFSRNSENIPITSLTEYNNNYYAATPNGLYKAPMSGINLQDFSAWDALDTSRNLISIAKAKDKIFTATIDSLFVLESDTFRYLYSNDSAMKNLDAGIDCIWVVENLPDFTGKAKRLNTEYIFTDSFGTDGYANEILDVADADSTKWIANVVTGLKKRTRKGEPFGTVLPNGPGGIASFDIYVDNKELAVAHGGYDDKYIPSFNGSGFSTYEDGEWKNYGLPYYAPFGDSVRDFTHITKGGDGTVYAGSAQSGLFILKPDGSYEYYKQNSFIDPSSTGETLYRISGIAFDNNGVFWATVYGGTPNELIARTEDGQWYTYSVPIPRNPNHSAAHLLIDDANQKWFAAPNGGGVIVYDDNQTPETQVDDTYIQLLAGEGSGGLPNNEVLSLAKDKDGAIWIGTQDGIGIVNCPSLVIERECESEVRVVQFDDFAGFLFQNEQVNTIAVDGANRKWIGTNNGVWLIAPDGDEIIERFTSDNSPLPSDIVIDIAVDGVTGDVYIGTELGLVSYKGTAVDGGRENSELITYPNPVPSGYEGTIAIKGFVENADVRITDISGQLVYRTTALGGQAVWNGKDYTGRRPQSGVYLIYATNKDGSQTMTGKMVFME